MEGVKLEKDSDLLDESIVPNEKKLKIKFVPKISWYFELGKKLAFAPQPTPTVPDIILVYLVRQRYKSKTNL